jgi:hypothetical protein
MLSGSDTIEANLLIVTFRRVRIWDRLCAPHPPIELAWLVLG